MSRNLALVVTLSALYLAPVASHAEANKNANVSAAIANQGRTIQIAQDGAFVNLLVVPDDKDDRRVTRIVTKPVDQYLIGIVAELRLGETNDYSYAMIIARAPRCEHAFLRDSQTKEIRGKGVRYTKLTLDNPESDSVEVLLESDPKTDTTVTKPIRYTNGCTRAWLFF